MESNHLPSGYEPPALTDELHPQIRVDQHQLTDESIADLRGSYIMWLRFHANKKTTQRSRAELCQAIERCPLPRADGLRRDRATDQLEWN